ncbi:hypothetical protein [Candidatus Nardonella dryophthoridicola]|uniref:Transposable element Tc3 transposase n=1 Tax=endosymbiont of Metamasius hemipterus TaxID=204627 RepID=A0ABT0TWF2_9GAMM|nr:hypothetical protein [Candidatus Nardonella dryophthoridicola]MCM0158329.1 hypothetical protein [endosymbiont of Metamasius hemipterus]
MFIGNRLLGPFFYQNTLTGERYLNMLQHQILPAIREVAQDEFENVWFQQDGCPVHNYRPVKKCLTETFGDKLISNGGPISWPARSPDLTPMDFYLWGHAKNEIYDFELPQTMAVLEARAREVFANVNRNTLQQVTNTVLKKCRACVAENGHHFVY